jgi:hypothetical protein
MLVLGRILVGFLLLVLGRRLYWLFVAAVGFSTASSSPRASSRGNPRR